MVTRSLLRLAAVAAMVFGVTGTASASTYTFNLHGYDCTCYNSLPHSFSQTQGGLTGTFAGKYLYQPSISGDTLVSGSVGDGRIGRYYGGAGVYNGSGDGQHTVDGVSGSNSYFDFVNMSFQKGGQNVAVKLVSLAFGYVAQGYRGTNDSYYLLSDTSGDGQIGVGDRAPIQNGDAGSYVALPALADLKAGVFGVAAGLYGSWKLKSVTVEYNPSVVPLPAAGWLLLAGVGGLAAMRRRKSRTV